MPADALYGAQTQRAVQNFPVSGQRLPEEFIRALLLAKLAAARANVALGQLTAAQGDAIGPPCQCVVTWERKHRHGDFRGANRSAGMRKGCDSYVTA